jgi:hypothetical protein
VSPVLASPCGIAWRTGSSHPRAIQCPMGSRAQHSCPALMRLRRCCCCTVSRLSVTFRLATGIPSAQAQPPIGCAACCCPQHKTASSFVITSEYCSHWGLTKPPLLTGSSRPRGSKPKSLHTAAQQQDATSTSQGQHTPPHQACPLLANLPCCWCPILPVSRPASADLPCCLVFLLLIAAAACRWLTRAGCHPGTAGRPRW